LLNTEINCEYPLFNYIPEGDFFFFFFYTSEGDVVIRLTLDSLRICIN
jgi:hypothetical protein